MLNERDKALVMFYLDQKIAEISTLKNSMNVCCSYTFAWSNANSDTQVKQFPGHMTDYILDRFTKEGVLSVFLAPHSSDQCQPLDLGIFGPQKKLHPSITVPAGVSTQTAQLVKMLESFQKVATVRNITAAFRRAGIMSSYNKEKGYTSNNKLQWRKKSWHFNHTEKEPLSKTHFHLTHDVPPLPKIPFSE